MQLQYSLPALDPESRKATIAQLFVLNEEHSLGKFKGDQNVGPKPLLEALEGDAERTLTNDTSVSYFSLDQDSTKATALVVSQPASWDSKQFDRPMAKLTLALFDPMVQRLARREILRNLIHRVNADMIAARVSLQDLRTIQALEDLGAVLTDTLLTFRFDLGTRKLPKTSNSFDVGLARSSDEQDLRRIGRTVFTIDRFHGDPNLPKFQSDLAYEEWVANSLHGFAEAVIVARRNSQVIGFITCKIDQIADALTYGVIDLVGVDSSFSNIGIGSELVISALHWFKSRVKSVYVGTQASNSRAVRIYEKSGFLQVHAEATLHLWLNHVNKEIVE
jgi:ribosomal protein S18 acetylase RimI-like enzyme